MSNKLELSLKKELPKIVTKIEIVDAVSMKNATETLSLLNQRLDSITEEKEKVTKPLNEALKAERARWKPYETQLEDAISMIRTGMSKYQTAEAKRIKDEADAIASRVKEGKGNLTLETASKKIAAIEKPADVVNTDVGQVKFRTDKKLKITDENKIPREYLVVDEKKLLDALKNGIVVSGAEIEEIQTPINFR